jgi:heme oxygenase
MWSGISDPRDAPSSRRRIFYANPSLNRLVRKTVVFHKEDPMTVEQNRPALRSKRLNLVTSEPHERLGNAVNGQAPFDTLSSYSRFLIAQYLFQAELKSLYNDASLTAIIPDLPGRCRAEQALADIADLQIEIPQPVSGAPTSLSKAQALGWLYVSEGSKLGAGILIKRAATLNLGEDFGARHLGAPAGGRAEGWKSFTRILDGLPMSDEEDVQIEQAAIDAFERFSVLIDHAYSIAPGSQRAAQMAES